ALPESSVGFLKYNRRKTGSLGVIAGAALALAVAVSASMSGDSGASADSNDAIAKLGHRLADGTASLEYGENGYLTSLLHLLGINVDSQVLVFSNNIFHNALINQTNPRVLYFYVIVSI